MNNWALRNSDIIEIKPEMPGWGNWADTDGDILDDFVCLIHYSLFFITCWIKETSLKTDKRILIQPSYYIWMWKMYDTTSDINREASFFSSWIVPSQKKKQKTNLK